MGVFLRIRLNVRGQIQKAVDLIAEKAKEV